MYAELPLCKWLEVKDSHLSKNYTFDGLPNHFSLQNSFMTSLHICSNPFSSTKVLPSMQNNTKQYGFFLNYYPSKSCLLSCDVNSGVHND
ncbi:MAG: hypothetical protein ACK55I_19950, partial [bacterium]